MKVFLIFIIASLMVVVVILADGIENHRHPFVTAQQIAYAEHLCAGPRGGVHSVAATKVERERQRTRIDYVAAINLKCNDGTRFTDATLPGMIEP